MAWKWKERQVFLYKQLSLLSLLVSKGLQRKTIKFLSRDHYRKKDSYFYLFSLDHL